MKLIDGKKMFMCRHCGKGFSLRNNAVRHEKTHQNTKPYSCEFCPKVFTEKGSVKKHMLNIHPEEYKIKRLIFWNDIHVNKYLTSHALNITV